MRFIDSFIFFAICQVSNDSVHGAFIIVYEKLECGGPPPSAAAMKLLACMHHLRSTVEDSKCNILFFRFAHGYRLFLRHTSGNYEIYGRYDDGIRQTRFYSCAYFEAQGWIISL